MAQDFEMTFEGFWLNFIIIKINLTISQFLLIIFKDFVSIKFCPIQLFRTKASSKTIKCENFTNIHVFCNLVRCSSVFVFVVLSGLLCSMLSLCMYN